MTGARSSSCGPKLAVGSWLAVDVTQIRLPQAVRALVLDQSDNVLLVHFDLAGRSVVGGFWACPGGGIDPGETMQDARRRELSEELGLDEFELHGPVWRLTRVFAMGAWDGQTDTTFLVRVKNFEPQPRVDLEAEGIHGLRWFSSGRDRQRSSGIQSARPGSTVRDPAL